MQHHSKQRLTVWHVTLALLATTIVAVTALTAASKPQSNEAGPQAVVSVQNEFLRVDTASTGSAFAIGTTGGDPSTTGDDNLRLLFGFAPAGSSIPGTSFTTLRRLGLQLVRWGPYTWNGVTWSNRPTITTCGAAATIETEVDIFGDAPASVVLMDDCGRTLGSMTRIADIAGGGRYRGSALAFAIVGAGVPQRFTIHKVAQWNDGLTLTDDVATYIERCIDPSGYIYNAGTNARLEGAIVTLYQKDPAGDVVWTAAEYDQINPQVTDPQGRYGWLTPAGDYYIRISRSCYADTTSRTVTVPPEVTDLNVGLPAVGCSPLQMTKAQAADGAGQIAIRLQPGAGMRLQATINNTSASAVTADVALSVYDAQGQTVGSLTQRGARVLNPGSNALTLEGTLPMAPEGEYTFVAQATYAQQTTMQVARFFVGRWHLYLPQALKEVSNVSPTPTATSTPTTGWQTIFADSFEGGFPGAWQRFGNPTWAQASCRASSGTSSIWPAAGGSGARIPCNDTYPNDAESRLTFGPFDLRGATAAELRFNKWQQTQVEHDFFEWYVSIDSMTYFGFKTSGDSGGWEAMRMDLSDVFMLGDLCGQKQVWIMFRFYSDGAVGEQGVFIDDVVLRKQTGGAGLVPPAPVAGETATPRLP